MQDTFIDVAEKKWVAAKHIAEVSYPSIGDPKLLMSSILALEECSRYIISAALKCEEVVPKLSFNLFFRKFKSNTDTGFDPLTFELSAMLDVHAISIEHENSKVEFPRQDKFVMADEDFHIDYIDKDHVKMYCKDIGSLLKKVREVVN